MAVLLNVTTPIIAGPFGILAIFVFAYLASLGVVTFFIYWVGRLLAHLSKAFALSRPFTGLNFKQSYYYSTIIAAAPIMLVGLQSVGSVGFYEIGLVILFVGIGCLYITKRVM